MQGTATLLLFAPTLALTGIALTGAAPPQQDLVTTIDDEKCEAVVFALADLIEEHYIFEEEAAEIAEKLKQQLVTGAYDGLTIPGALAGALTRDVRSVNNDLHLGVRPLGPDDLRSADEDPAESRRAYLAQARASNYGFQKIEIMAGNVGYLDLRGFTDASIGGETAIAAMAFLANTDALIIDLRQNGGGSPSMIQLLCSYFFEEPTHLNSFEYRGREFKKQFWSLPHVPGKKLYDTPLFVLTSGRTFSAAEEFSYNLRNLERATLVGEATGGGAHPGGTHPVEGAFSVFIPDGRAINPITGTNWEGVGVEPHVPVDASKALDEAQRLAREAIRG